MNLVVLPVVGPLLTGLLLLFVRRPSRGRRTLALASAALQAAFAGWLLVETNRTGPLLSVAGGWPAAAGIALVVDPLAALMLVLSAVTVFAVVLFGCIEQSPRVEHPLRLPLLMFLVAGTNLAFVTADLFNLFVAFEVILVGSSALLTLEADDWEVKHAFPYVALNLLGSALFLVAAALAYGLCGTLNFAELAARTDALRDDPRLTALALLLFAVFGLKAGLFPLHYWLPNSYPTLPSPLGALYAALLTKVGVYALLRIFGTVLPPDLPVVPTLFMWVAAASLVIGVLGALARDFIRGSLSLLLTQVGFMVMAAGFAGRYAFTAAIYYLIHHVLAMASLFLLTGIIIVLNRTDHLQRGAQLGRAAPLLGGLFLLQGLSLAGVPPLSGFWGKYMIIVRGLELGAPVLVAAALLTSLLTFVVMLRILNRVFWSRPPDQPVRAAATPWKPLTAVVAGLTALSLWVGLQPELFLRLSANAAATVLDRPGYVAFVRGEAGR